MIEIGAGSKAFLKKSKRFSVDLARPVFFDHLEMKFCPVTFVAGKIIMGKFLMEPDHHPVAGDFGDY